MGNRVRIERKSIGKRGLALLLALVTAITSWSLDWNALSVKAADNSSELTVPESFQSNAPVTWTYTNPNSNTVKVDRVYFKFNAVEDAEYAYSVNMVQSGGTALAPIAEQTIYGDADGPQVQYFEPTDVYLDEGDTLTITMTMRSAAGSNIDIFRSASGDYFAVTVSNAQIGGNDATVNITGNDIVTYNTNDYLNLAVGQTSQLGYTIDYTRDVTFSATGSAITISPQGLITAVSPGTSTVTATTGRVGDTNDTITVHVVDAGFTTDSFNYTSREIRPDTYISVNGASALTLGTDYTVAYANNTNVGTATATITGKNEYAGYSQALDFIIEPKDISSLSTYFDQGTATYTVDTAASAVTITDVRDTVNDAVLTQGTDFNATARITGSEIISNTKYYYYEVNITGIGNYTGTLTKTNIRTTESAGLSMDNVYTYELDGTQMTYDGTAKEMGVTVYDRNQNPISNLNTEGLHVEYVPVTGADTTNPGRVEVKVTSDIYDGELSGLTYDIVLDITDATYATISSTTTPLSTGSNGVASYKYTGAEIKPGISVVAGTRTLAQGTDYTVTYSNNIGSATEPAYATYTVTGSGFYTGEKTYMFRIVPPLSGADIVFDGKTSLPANSANSWHSDYAVEYTGSQIRPAVRLLFNGNNRSNEVAMLAYGDNPSNITVANGGSVTITTDRDSIFGTQQQTAYFNIAAKDISQAVFDAGDYGTITYDGTEKTLTTYNETTNPDGYKVTLGTRILQKDVDYTVSYYNNVNAGTAIINVTGTGNYTGNLSGNFTISPYDLSTGGTDVDLTVSNASYSGTPVTPDVTLTVRADGATPIELTSGTDYTAAFSNNINVGNSAVARITGIQNFTGTITQNFSVVPRAIISSSIRYKFAGAEYFDGVDNRDTLSFDATHKPVWSGYASSPAVAIYDGETKLKRGLDYNVAYTRNQDVSTSLQWAEATITGMGNYANTGTVTIRYEIVKCPISADRIRVNTDPAAGVTSIVDNGASGTPTLVADTDYEVTNDSSSGGGIKTATITGKGLHYTGERTITYTRGQDLKDINNIELTDPNHKAPPLGDCDDANDPLGVIFLGQNRPTITIGTGASAIDVNSSDAFDVEYTVTQGDDPDGYAAGSYVTATVTANENTEDYYGTRNFYYYVVPARIQTAVSPDLYDITISATSSDYAIKVDDTANATYEAVSATSGYFKYSYLYRAGDINPQLTLTYSPFYGTDPGTGQPHELFPSGRYTMIEGVDYQITADPGRTFPGDPDADAATFTIAGMGNFRGSINLKFSVATRDLAEIPAGSTETRGQIAAIPDQVYNGEAHVQPEITVTYDGETLVLDEDYEVTYSNDTTPRDKTAANPPTVTVTGIGNYRGSISAPYSIVKTELTNDNTTVSIFEKYAYDATAHEFNTTDPESDSYIDKLVRVKYGNQTLKYEDHDFDIEYEDNIYPGVATLKIKPGSNNKYSVSATNAPYGEYTIYLNLTDTGLYKVIGIQNTADYGWNNAVAGKYDYTPAHDNAAAKWEYHNGGGERLTMAGVKIRPLDAAQGHEVTGHDLVMDTNFTETWNSMTVPGSGRSIVIAGKGATNNYCIGTISIPCEIYGDLSQATVEVAEIQAYRGDTAVIQPEPSVIFDGQRLPGSYYQTTYYHVSDDYHSVLSDNNTRTITVTATDAGYYTGSATAEYRILYNLNDAVISGVNASYSYRDASTVPEPTVDMTGKANGPLEKDRDYVLTKTSNNPADPTCTVAGSTITYTISAKDGVSYGSKSISYTITGESLSNGTLSYELTPASYTYTGSEIKPVPTNVALDGRPLTRGTDYYLSWSNNVNAGTGLITFNGMGNYTGRQTKNFTINPKAIDSADIVAVFPSSYQYQGGAIVKPTDMYLTDRGANKTLRLATDIQQTAWDNATGVTDSATVTTAPLASALGANYTGSRTDTYSIVPLDLQSATVTASATEATYDGTEKTPSLTVRVGERTLTSGVDYVVSSIVNSETGAATPHPVDAGTYTLIISPKDGIDYIINSKTVDFTINPKELNTSGFTSTYTYTTEGAQQTKNRTETIRFAYTGAECRMDSVSLRDNALGNLTEGDDFEISYSDNITDSAAEGDDDAPTVTITGKGNYTGTIDKKYNIGTDISDMTRATLTNTTFTYNGNEQKPAVTVRFISGPHNGEVLSPDYYDISYIDTATDEEDPIHAGTKNVIISGKNGYYGNVKDSSTNNTPQYTINPKNATTAAETSKLTFALNLSKEAGMYVSNYTGSEVEPTVTIYDTQISRSVPVDSSNYTVEYEHNTSVSTASTPANVKITMRGDYTAYTKNINFKIKPIAFNNTTRVTVHYPDPSDPYFAYTAEEIEPEVTVTQTVNGAEYTLVEDTDYEVTYTDNVVPGDATVRVTGKGNFSTESTRVERFRIKADLGEVFPLNGVPLGDDSSITIGTQFYAGASIDPTATVVIEGETLTQGGNVASDDVDFYTTPMDPSDYDLANNIGYVYLTGCGRYYTGTCTASFELSDDVETLLSVAFYETNADGENEVVTSVPYNGATQKLRGMIVDQNGAAVYTFDASTDGVTYSNSTDGATCKNVGTVTVTVPFTYMGSDYEKTGTYSITTTSLADATVTCPANVIYNGTPREPVIVTYDGRTLTKNTDYTITYTNNTNPGVTAVSGNNVTATYTINGAGNFTGTREGTFTVRVQDMSGLTATPGANSMRLNWDAKGYVTGYKLRVYNTAGTMLNEYNIANKNVSTYTVNNLTAGTSYSFRLIGYVQTTADTYLSNPQVIVAATSMATPTITGSVSGGKPAIGLPTAQGDAKIIIYRSTVSGSGYNLLAVISDGRSVFRDNSAASGRTYYYIAKYATVVNGTLQQSDASNEVTVTAP